MANKSNCAPANSKAYDDADVAANEMIMAMKATAETAQPMPNIPQMSVMWGPTNPGRILTLQQRLISRRHWMPLQICSKQEFV